MTNYNTQELDEILAKFSTARDYPADMYEEAKNEAKQAITSLIKELVAEAKPEYAGILPEDYDMFGDYNHVKRMRNATIGEFEQNLLKALEEV